MCVNIAPYGGENYNCIYQNYKSIPTKLCVLVYSSILRTALEFCDILMNKMDNNYNLKFPVTLQSMEAKNAFCYISKSY